MAPEQASGDSDAIGSATDIYALGVLLYELLTGRCPIEGSSAVETLRRLVSEVPPGPRRLRREIPRDLEAVCLKCLEKAPERRYGTAGDLIRDLDRFLSGQATAARPVGPAERLWRWTRRRPAQAALLLVVLIGTSLAAAGLALHAARVERFNRDLSLSLNEAQDARRRAEQSEQRIQEMLYAADIRLAARARQTGDFREAQRLVERHVPQGGARDRRGFEWYLLSQQLNRAQRTIPVSSHALYAPAFAPDGSQFAAAGQNGTIRLYDARTLARLAEWPSQQGEVNGIAYSPEGRELASAGEDGTLRIWDVPTRTLVRTIPAHTDQAFNVRFYAGGRRLASCGQDPVIRLWDRRSGRSLGALQGHTRTVEALAVSPDGRRLASAGSDARVCLWDLDQAQQIGSPVSRSGRVLCVAFSGDGASVLDAGLNRQLSLRSVATGRRQRTASHVDAVHCVAFSPDGHRVACGDRGGTVTIWPLVTDAGELRFGTEPIDRWHAHQGRVYGLAFSPDGQRLLSAGQDGDLQVREFGPAGGRRTLSDNGVPIQDFTFVARHSLLATLQQRELVVWDVHQGVPLARQALEPGAWNCVVSSPTGDWIAVGGDRGRIALHDPQTGALQRCRTVPLERIHQMAVSPDGRVLACIEDTPETPVVLLDVSRGALRRIEMPQRCGAAAFSPDGRRLALVRGNDVLLWNRRTARFERTLRGHTGAVSHLAFHPDGQLLASCGNDRQIRLWDIETGQERFTLGGHIDHVCSAAFSPDGRTLITGDIHGGDTMWHTATGQPLSDLGLPLATCTRLQFSSDGRLLAILDRENHRVELIDVTAAAAAPADCRSPAPRRDIPACPPLRRKHAARPRRSRP